MAYELEAFLGAESTIDAAIKDLEEGHCVSLAQGVAMIPMTSGLLEELQEGYVGGEEPLDETLEGYYLTAAVAKWAQAASRDGLLAYISAAFANVMGGQSAIIWQNCAEVKRLSDDDSVNQVLRLLGVSCDEGLDEWDTVGLGRCRQTEKWLNRAKS